MSSKHRTLKKTFETEMWINNRKLPLNNFIQETLANMIVGFLKTLKELEGQPKAIKIEIKQLARPVEVDAHNYP